MKCIEGIRLFGEGLALSKQCCLSCAYCQMNTLHKSKEITLQGIWFGNLAGVICECKQHHCWAARSVSITDRFSRKLFFLYMLSPGITCFLSLDSHCE